MAQTHPLHNKLVVLIGGSGFIGRHVAQHLLALGARLRIAGRHPQKAFSLKPLANLGQLQFARCDVAKPESLAAVLAGADAAVYLPGSFGKDQKQVQADGAGNAAKAAAAAGVGAFVLLSAIDADAASPSPYLSSKGAGEDQARAAFPGVTIIRPSLVFGEEAGFVPLFAGLLASMPVLPLFCADAPMQPVYVDDVADAVVAALTDPAQHGGKIYEAAGPEVMTMAQLHRAMAAAQGRDPWLLALPDPLAKIIAALPLTPITTDKLRLLAQGNVATPGLPGLADMGITVRPLSLFLDRWMVRYRKHGRFTPSGKPA